MPDTTSSPPSPDQIFANPKSAPLPDDPNAQREMLERLEEYTHQHGNLSAQQKLGLILYLGRFDQDNPVFEYLEQSDLLGEMGKGLTPQDYSSKDVSEHTKHTDGPAR